MGDLQAAAMLISSLLLRLRFVTCTIDTLSLSGDTHVTVAVSTYYRSMHITEAQCIVRCVCGPACMLVISLSHSGLRAWIIA